jgi:hypothetical protein
MSGKVVFAHLRRHDPFGGLSPYGGITLAIKDDVTGAEVGIAVCHDDDRYVKRAGRARAEGRLHSVSADQAKYRLTLPGVSQDELMATVYGNLEAHTEKTEQIASSLYEALKKAGAQL